MFSDNRLDSLPFVLFGVRIIPLSFHSHFSRMELNVGSSDGKKFKLDLFLVLTFKNFFVFNQSYNLYLTNK